MVQTPSACLSATPTPRLRHGSLFSGIGGFDLGFERAGFTTLWQVEIDPYCLKVLEKNFPDANRCVDIHSVHGVLAHAKSHARQLQQGQRKSVRDQSAKHGASGIAQCADCLSPVDVITGGFPCQPFSVAGKRRGTADDRYLWSEMRRVIEEVRPRWIVAENVPGLIKLALDQVLSDLEALGYTVVAVTLPACAVDAPHRRERIWIVAHDDRARDARASRERASARCARQSSRPELWTKLDDQARNGGQDVAHATQQRGQRGPMGPRQAEPQGPRERVAGLRRWEPEPDVDRVAYGVPARVDRLKCLGNAVVPQLAEEIASMIRRAEASIDGGET